MKYKNTMLSEGLLKKLPTRRLLKYLASLHTCMESSNPCWCDVESREIQWKKDKELYKDSPEWQKHYEFVKSVLNGREHVVR